MNDQPSIPPAGAAPGPTAADVTARRTHLRTLAVAGTLAAIGGFTALAATATDSATTDADRPAAARAGSVDDGFPTLPTDDASGGDDAGVDGTYFAHGPRGSSDSAIGPPQGTVGPGGAGPSMSGGS